MIQELVDIQDSIVLYTKEKNSVELNKQFSKLEDLALKRCELIMFASKLEKRISMIEVKSVLEQGK